MLDEPSLGLSPLLCKELFRSLTDVARHRRRHPAGRAERAGRAWRSPTAATCSRTAHRRREDTAEALLRDPAVQPAYLGGGARRLRRPCPCRRPAAPAAADALAGRTAATSPSGPGASARPTRRPTRAGRCPAERLRRALRPRAAGDPWAGAAIPIAPRPPKAAEPARRIAADAATAGGARRGALRACDLSRLAASRPSGFRPRAGAPEPPQVAPPPLPDAPGIGHDSAAAPAPARAGRRSPAAPPRSMPPMSTEPRRTLTAFLIPARPTGKADPIRSSTEGGMTWPAIFEGMYIGGRWVRAAPHVRGPEPVRRLGLGASARRRPRRDARGDRRGTGRLPGMGRPALHQARAPHDQGRRSLEKRRMDDRRGAAGRGRRLVRQGHVREPATWPRSSTPPRPRLRRHRRGAAVGARQAVDGGAPADGRGHRASARGISPCILTVARPRLRHRRRQHARAQALGGNALHRWPALRRDLRGGGRAAGRAQRRDLLARERRREVGDELIEQPARQGHLLHRLHRRRPPDRGQRGRAPEEVLRRTRRQGQPDRAATTPTWSAPRRPPTSAASCTRGRSACRSRRCWCTSSIFDHFLKRFVERAARLKVGDPTQDKANVIGPLINDKQAAKVKEQIDDALAKGAKVVLGGKMRRAIRRAHDPDRRDARDEGLPGRDLRPVVPVIPFRTDDEAVAIANDTEYGLSAGRDDRRRDAAAWRIAAGSTPACATSTARR